MKREEFIKDLRENPSKYHYKVTWFINVLAINGRKYSVGYCHYGKGVAFITKDTLRPFFINEVLVQPEIEGHTPMLCSGAVHCKNKKCPLAKGKSRHDFEEIEKKLEVLGLLSKVNGKKWMFDRPLIEITVARNRRSK
jgi:hypothetical protein